MNGPSSEVSLTLLAKRDWRQWAACLGADPGLFFPHRGRGLVRPALKVCARCVVIEECLDYALEIGTSADFGIWGGTTPTQRIRLRQKTPTASR